MSLSRVFPAFQPHTLGGLLLDFEGPEDWFAQSCESGRRRKDLSTGMGCRWIGKAPQTWRISPPSPNVGPRHWRRFLGD